MKIQLLAEGHTKWDRFIKNWGISFLIDDDVLFDTFGKKKLKVDAAKIKHIVISHEHWDHTTGLWDILAINKNVTVYVCSHSDEKKKKKIKSYGVKLQEIGGQFEIKKNIYSIGEFSKDGVLYEQALCLKTEKGLIILTGWAHPGIVKIIEKAKQQFPDEIYAVIGGFHLKDSILQEIKNIIAELKTMNIKYFIPLHCTGKVAVNLFKKNLHCVSLDKLGGNIEF
jgi:7,8-dihydropterin-6-yl-methyl-4-(beta-D-ribofuranosyl)aminobenzene 5'-phosphate synthase